MSWIEGILWWRDAKVVEPRKRKHGDGLTWVGHRFPIKGGISWRDAAMHDMVEQSTDWVERLKIKVEQAQA